MIVASNGLVECVKILAPYETGIVDYNGHSALMYAALSGELDCVNLLLQEKVLTNYMHSWRQDFKMYMAVLR